MGRIAKSHQTSELQIIFDINAIVALGFELRALHLLGRCSTSLAA
jgi:hypothetical protein